MKKRLQRLGRSSRTGRMMVGYARVSTEEQSLELQRQALATAGCHVVLEDQITGVARRRPGLDKVLARLNPGDVLVVWRLDRLGRSLSHLIEVIGVLGARKIGFRSLSESIDTTTAGGSARRAMTERKISRARAMISDGVKVADVAKCLNVGKSTLYRTLRT